MEIEAKILINYRYHYLDAVIRKNKLVIEWNEKLIFAIYHPGYSMAFLEHLFWVSRSLAIVKLFDKIGVTTDETGSLIDEIPF